MKLPLIINLTLCLILMTCKVKRDSTGNYVISALAINGLNRTKTATSNCGTSTVINECQCQVNYELNSCGNNNEKITSLWTASTTAPQLMFKSGVTANARENVKVVAKKGTVLTITNFPEFKGTGVGVSSISNSIKVYKNFSLCPFNALDNNNKITTTSDYYTTAGDTTGARTITFKKADTYFLSFCTGAVSGTPQRPSIHITTP